MSEDGPCPECGKTRTLSLFDLTVHLDSKGEWHEMHFSCSECGVEWIEDIDVTDLSNAAGGMYGQ